MSQSLVRSLVYRYIYMSTGAPRGRCLSTLKPPSVFSADLSLSSPPHNPVFTTFRIQIQDPISVTVRALLVLETAFLSVGKLRAVCVR